MIMEIPAFDRMIKMLAVGLSLWGFILNGIFLACFANLAFNNTDPEECWVSPLDDP